jgi:hypothetical protein
MKPAEILKKGLAKLQNQNQNRKAVLEARLKTGQPISESDEEWLDHTGNLVEEERLVDGLDQASDYEQELKRLCSHEKYIVNKLTSLAENSGKSFPSLNKCGFIWTADSCGR